MLVDYIYNETMLDLYNLTIPRVELFIEYAIISRTKDYVAVSRITPNSLATCTHAESLSESENNKSSLMVTGLRRCSSWDILLVYSSGCSST